jgi:hypothetical protein
VPSSELVSEKDDIFFVSEIHIERCDAAPPWDRIETTHVNTAAIEPDPHAAHKIAERIATSAFNACAECRRSAHIALLVACRGGSALISQSATCLVLDVADAPLGGTQF